MGEVLELNTVDNIINSIYIIRGQQVMLDSDLAKIYGYEVKRLNEQVKRNIKRFPEDFMFQLVESEIPDSLKSQFATLNINENKRGMHIKKMPYVFTEQGIYMLATVLKGELAERLIRKLILYATSVVRSCMYRSLICWHRRKPLLESLVRMITSAIIFQSMLFLSMNLI